MHVRVHLKQILTRMRAHSEAERELAVDGCVNEGWS